MVTFKEKYKLMITNIKRILYLYFYNLNKTIQSKNLPKNEIATVYLWISPMYNIIYASISISTPTYLPY